MKAVGFQKGERMRRKRRNHTAAFKAKVALEAAKEEKTLAELAQQYGVHANQISSWKRQLLENVDAVFASGAEQKQDHEAEVKELRAKVGELVMERDFLSSKLER